MREGSRHEQVPPAAIELDPTWAKKLSELKFESSVEEIPSPVQSCKLSIGKTAVYISRTDFFDVAHSSQTPLFEQVARLLLSEGKIIDVKIDNAILAPDTFKQLADTDATFREIVRIFNIQTETASASDATLEDLRKRSNAEVKRKMDQKEWFLEQPHHPRKMVRLDDIEARAIDVPMGIVTSIDQNSPQRYIVTLGAGPCFIVGACNAETQASGLTHIDAFTPIQNVIKRLIDSVQTESVKVFGGDMSSLTQLIQLKELFERLGINVDEWDVLNETKSIAIDKQTGEFLDVQGRSNIR